MGDDQRTATTLMLRDARTGDPAARDHLFARVYDELHQIAARELHGASTPTMQPTALVNEACLRLLDTTRLDVADRSHFFALAATVMRRVLVDRYRRAHSGKRGGERLRVTLDERLAPGDEGLPALDVLALDDALARLALLDERKARVVELRFFAGLEVAEVAVVLGVSERTVATDWHFARAWLRGELRSGSEA
jgi:RNA polymerase sigma factor (TIGR02999 family)